MHLRPELTPPALDEEPFTRLAELADHLDGAGPGEGDDELAEFNRLAGTALALADFQDISSAEDPEDFVRRVLFRQAIRPDPTLTREEMTEIVSRATAVTDDSDFYLELFLANCKHPSGTDLIYWPNLVPELPQDRDPTPEEITDLALRGRP
jgi:hypothetical protein